GGSGAVSWARLALALTRRPRRTVRPQARFPPPGDEPGGEDDGRQGRWPPRVGAYHRREGGAREDARAGPECRVAPAACCSSCRLLQAPARRRWSNAWWSSCRISECHGPIPRGSRVTAKPTEWTIISYPASASRR